MIGSQSQLNRCITTALDVNGTMVQTSKMIKYLGAYLDNGLSFKHHISTKCRTAVEFTMPETTLTIPHSPSLHHPCSRTGRHPFGLCQLCIHQSSSIKHQQDAESAKYSCQICVKLKRMDICMEVLKTLHWLPIKFRIQFKILLLVYKCLNGLAPSYLSELLELKSTISRLGPWSLCDRTLLCIPFTRRMTLQIGHLV